jgi:hypothetical protein
MVRGGALTLAAVVTLGIASGARGQDMPSWGLSPPSFSGVFPSLPQNWADLPVQFKISESVGYNSNIENTPNVSGINSLIIGHPIAAFESISTFGASTKAYWGSQQFFLDGSIGMYRYLDHASLDRLHSSFDAGVNWIYTSRCSGTLVASELSTPSPQGQQVAFNVLNTITTESLKETGTCRVTGDWAAVFNSGITNSTNTATADQFNNFQSVFVAAGMSYTVSATNSLQLLATITGTHYANRGALTGLAGLLQNVTTDQVNLTYTKDFGPNVAVIASVGLIGTKDVPFGFGIASGFEPQYSLAVTWSVTPKLGLDAAVQRSVTPPTAVIGNLQTTESAQVGLHYTLTPKVQLSAGVNTSRSSSTLSNVAISALSAIFPTLSNQSNSYGLQAAIAYAMTPFLAASLSYQYTRTVQTNFVTPSSLILLNLSFAPY